MKKIILCAAAAAALAGCSDIGATTGDALSLAATNCRDQAATEFNVGTGDVTVTPVDATHYEVSVSGKSMTCEVTESGDVVGIAAGL